MKSSPFTSLTFNDKRISARANLTLSKMIATGNSVINRIFSNFADKTATYRMFNNPKVTMESIVSAYADACKARMAESHCTHVLCLQDTCEINYNGAKKGEHVSMPSVEVQVKGIVEPVLSVSSPINGDKQTSEWKNVGGAERYNYISYFKQEATEDCLMEVSRLNLVGMKYDSDDMEVEYSVDNPNSYTQDRGALADEVGQAGWTVKHYAIYKDALTIDAFWTVEAKSDAGLISPEMDLSKDNGKFRVKLRACAEYLPAYEREIYHQAQSVRVKAEGDQFSGATFLESRFSDLQKVGFCPLTNGVNDAKLNVSGATVSLAGNNIVVNNPQKAAVALYTLDGMLVASDNSCAEVVTLPVAAHGKYVVKVGKQSVKLVF